VTSAKLKEEVSGRIKEARERLEQTQKEMAARAGLPFPSYRDYELGKTIPGGEALLALMHAGLSPAWLLEARGPMLLAELDEAATWRARAEALQAERDTLAARLEQGQGAPINQPAMRAIIAGTVEAKAPGAPADQIARMAVDYYCRAISEGMITAEGIGDGNLKKAG